MEKGLEKRKKKWRLSRSRPTRTPERFKESEKERAREILQGTIIRDKGTLVGNNNRKGKARDHQWVVNKEKERRDCSSNKRRPDIVKKGPLVSFRVVQGQRVKKRTRTQRDKGKVYTRKLTLVEKKGQESDKRMKEKRKEIEKYISGKQKFTMVSKRGTLKVFCNDAPRIIIIFCSQDHFNRLNRFLLPSPSMAPSGSVYFDFDPPFNPVGTEKEKSLFRNKNKSIEQMMFEFMVTLKSEYKLCSTRSSVQYCVHYR